MAHAQSEELRRSCQLGRDRVQGGSAVCRRVPAAGVPVSHRLAVRVRWRGAGKPRLLGIAVAVALLIFVFGGAGDGDVVFFCFGVNKRLYLLSVVLKLSVPPVILPTVNLRCK